MTSGLNHHGLLSNAAVVVTLLGHAIADCPEAGVKGLAPVLLRPPVIPTEVERINFITQNGQNFR